jgi:hypothetical protein
MSVGHRRKGAIAAFVKATFPGKMYPKNNWFTIRHPKTNISAVVYQQKEFYVSDLVRK